MPLLRLCRLAITLVGVALAVAALGSALWQEWSWARHGVWPDLRFAHAWQWARIDPNAAMGFLGPATRQSALRLPLWAGLIVPAIIIGFVAIKLGHWVNRDEQRQAETPPQKRDAA